MQPSTRVAVTVTFLRMEQRPGPGPVLPAGLALIRLGRCSVPFYRYLYDTVGADYVWWLRRTLPDATLAGVLAEPLVSVHVLYRDGEPAGFFELDRRAAHVCNLSYFGLLPQAVGLGIGRAFLAAAVREAWAGDTRAVTVNTCTADHARALPTYVEAGFRIVRRLDEVWDVPTRLGLAIPRRLLA